MSLLWRMKTKCQGQTEEALGSRILSQNLRSQSLICESTPPSHHLTKSCTLTLAAAWLALCLTSSWKPSFYTRAPRIILISYVKQVRGTESTRLSDSRTSKSSRYLTKMVGHWKPSALIVEAYLGAPNAECVVCYIPALQSTQHPHYNTD